MIECFSCKSNQVFVTKTTWFLSINGCLYKDIVQISYITHVNNLTAKRS